VLRRQAHAAAAEARAGEAARQLEGRTHALAAATAEVLQLKRRTLDTAAQMEAALLRAADGEREVICSDAKVANRAR
jgi:hypothetical protein